jgi:hypothetical protein
MNCDCHPDLARFNEDFLCHICGNYKAGPCHTCGRDGSHRPECRDWAYCDPCFETMLEECDRIMRETKPVSEEVMASLEKEVRLYKNDIAWFRRKLAEAGFEVTIETIQKTIDEIHDEGLELKEGKLLERLIGEDGANEFRKKTKEL